MLPVATTVSRVGADGETAAVARLDVARAAVAGARGRARDFPGGRIVCVVEGHPVEAVHDVRARGVRSRVARGVARGVA